MPSLPTPLAARAERWFGRPATVVEITALSPGLARVGFAGPHRRGRSWVRGQEVEFQVGDREFRHDTPADVDPESGRFDVVFVRHGDGPGTAWLAGLGVGSEVGVMGPGGGLRREPDRRELFLGDATALGLFAALIPTSGDARGAVEVPPRTSPRPPPSSRASPSSSPGPPTAARSTPGSARTPTTSSATMSHRPSRPASPGTSGRSTCSAAGSASSSASPAAPWSPRRTGARAGGACDRAVTALQATL